MVRELRFSNLTEVEGELDRLVRARDVQTSGVWSYSQILNHTAETIEHSMSRYPQLMPAVIRKTVGHWFFERMARRGYMEKGKFNPSAPKKHADGDEAAAMKRLRQALKTFRSYEGSMAVHPIYDQLKKSDFEKLHSMHIANHLSFVEPVQHSQMDSKSKRSTISGTSSKGKPGKLTSKGKPARKAKGLAKKSVKKRK
ncbi:MAG: DUF1569 domain-containing protein [Spirochaetia bacterium]|nr:DUF1569 domain-containing protein [Spirochaetia bacterium]